jgi:hypothetical protein
MTEIITVPAARVTLDQLRDEVSHEIVAAGKRINPNNIRRFTIKVARKQYQR